MTKRRRLPGPVGRLAFVVAILMVALLGGAYRALNWPDVFRPDAVRFQGDADVLYHVLRTEQFVRGAGEVWTDPEIEYPLGAHVLWPPGFDAVTALVARAFRGSDATRGAIERIAAWAPVMWGVATLLLIAAIAAAWFGRVVALVATFLAAILPVNAWWSILGRPDHHVAELFLLLLALLALERSSRGSRWTGWSGVLGLALGISPWFWQGSALYVGFLASFVALIYLAGKPQASEAAIALARGAGIAVLVFCMPLLLSLPPQFFRPISLAGVSAFPAALLGMTALWALAISRAAARPGSMGTVQRLLTALGSGLVCTGLLAAAFPAVVIHGMRALTSSDTFWATVAEARPLVSGRPGMLGEELAHAALFVGPVLVAPLLAIPALRRRLARGDPGGPWLASWGAFVFVLLGLRSMRFLLYAGPFAFLFAGVFVDDIREKLRQPLIRGLTTGLILLVFAYPGWVNARLGAPAVEEDIRTLLVWLRGHVSIEGSVLAPWEHGHAIRHYTGRPVVLTPFGTDIGYAGSRDFAQFLYARDPGEARAILSRRRARFVLLDPVAGALQVAYPYAPPGTDPAVRLVIGKDGKRMGKPAKGYDLVAGVVLHDFDGAPDQLPERKAFADYRLVYETPDRDKPPSKLFEVVPGAVIVVAGLKPGEEVRLELPVRTNQGRRFTWWTVEQASTDGVVRIRQPYATGLNGAVIAGSSVLSTSKWRWIFSVDGRDVLEGRELRCRTGNDGPTCDVGP